MKSCVIADFEWGVTPHPVSGDRFIYFNEILSAGAVRLSEDGKILDSFYRLILPENAAFLHPVILSSLRLDREELASSPDFSAVFAEFLTFVGTDPVLSWGCADQSALTQNLRIKGSPALKQRYPTGTPALSMRDLQPVLCRGFDIPSPYPGLAAVLAKAGISNDDNRHNALSDAEDTAKLLSRLLVLGNPAAEALLLPASGCRSQQSVRIPTQSKPVFTEDSVFRSVGECLRTARRFRRKCPVCGGSIGIGTWLRHSSAGLCTICCCDKDGKFFCTIEAVTAEDGYRLKTDITPLDAEKRAVYISARRAARGTAAK